MYVSETYTDLLSRAKASLKPFCHTWEHQGKEVFYDK